MVLCTTAQALCYGQNLQWWHQNPAQVAGALTLGRAGDNRQHHKKAVI